MSQTAAERSTYERDVDRVVAALLRQHREGTDVGDLLAAACRQASKRLAARDEYLTSNRPGSWEAAHVEELARGWDWDL